MGEKMSSTRLLKRLMKKLRKEGFKLEMRLDEKTGVLEVPPIATIVEQDGVMQISFFKDAVPNGVAWLIMIAERGKLKYDICEHFKFNDRGKRIWETDDKHFWDESKTKSELKIQSDKRMNENPMYG